MGRRETGTAHWKSEGSLHGPLSGTYTCTYSTIQCMYTSVYAQIHIIVMLIYIREQACIRVLLKAIFEEHVHFTCTMAVHSVFCYRCFRLSSSSMQQE